MSERVGQEVSGDTELLSYARILWASGDYQSWRTHMRQDVADTLRGPSPDPVVGYFEEA